MKKRVISGAVLVAIVLVLYLIKSTIPFITCIGLVSVLGLKEILDLKESHKKLPTYIKVISYLCLLLTVLGKIKIDYILLGIPFLSICLTSLLLTIPTIFEFDGKYTTRDAFYLIGAITFLGAFFNLLILIFSYNRWLLLYLILVATMTDTFAMLIGSLIGKHKLIPKVSPNKSIEGSLFGTLVATAVASIFYVNVITSNINLFVLILMTVCLSVLGQLGDLLFSKIKRENEIKDFSQIMPGHGGVLDRLDSLSFITLGYILIINIINLF